MNLKKFISDNIIDIGEHTENTAQQTPADHPVSTALPENKSFINKQNAAAPANYGDSHVHNTGVVSSDALTGAREQIKKAMADSNRTGTDYFEFVLTKNAMSSIPVEEERYKVAFAGLSATGLTKDIINSSANFYKTVIGNELKDFQDQFAQLYKTEVVDKKDAVAAKQKQMIQLSEQINKLNEEIKRLSDDVQQCETGFIMKKNAFEQAASEAQTDIQSELDKINQYIK